MNNNDQVPFNIDEAVADPSLAQDAATKNYVDFRRAYGYLIGNTSTTLTTTGAIF